MIVLAGARWIEIANRSTKPGLLMVEPSLGIEAAGAGEDSASSLETAQALGEALYL